MPDLMLTNIPDDLYQRLRTRAERSGQSVEAEVLLCLQRALAGEGDAASLLERARQIRSRMPGIFLTDADLRAFRDEGRP